MIIDKIMESFKEMGISPGDVVEVSSDIRALVPAVRHEEKLAGKSRSSSEAVMDMIIDRLQDLVGKEGTLLFPTYSWGFCKGEPWDYDNTPGVTGALSNHALKRPDFKRTKHPIYSFAVWGKDADYLVGLENTDSFGEDGPFGYLYREGKCNISIGANVFFTFKHYIEQCNNVPFRFIKDFSSLYIINGKKEIKTYSMYVRYLEPREALDMPVEISGILEGDPQAIMKKDVQGISLTLLFFKEIFNIVSDDIKNNNYARVMRWKD